MQQPSVFGVLFDTEFELTHLKAKSICHLFLHFFGSLGQIGNLLFKFSTHSLLIIFDFVEVNGGEGFGSI